MAKQMKSNIQENGRTPSKSKPKKKMDWKIIKKLCQMQCTIGEICGLLELSEDTMLRACKQNYGATPSEKFSDWYEGGKCSLRRSQWLLAETSAAMGIFLGKQILKQSDDYNVNHKGDLSFQIVNYGNKEPKQWVNEDERDSEE
jgi:hypothetical protein